jgi:hypothetical protein
MRSLHCANNCHYLRQPTEIRHFTPAKFGTGLASPIPGGANIRRLVRGRSLASSYSLETLQMKPALFVLCLLSTSAAFAQYVGGASYISNEPQIYQFASHPAHASYAPMSQEQNVLAATTYSTAQGERPASDFPHAESVSLGAAARELRQQHAQLKKSPIVWVNQ